MLVIIAEGHRRRNVEQRGRLLMPAEALPLLAGSQTVLRRNISLAPLSLESVVPILEERKQWRDSLRQLGVATPQPPTAEESEDWKLGPELVLRRRGGKAKAMGTAFHRIMQHVQLDADPMLDRMIEQTAAVEGIGSDVDSLAEIVHRTLAHPLLERARNAKRVWRELPFSLELNGHITEGYIDLLFEEEDGLVLVDYKTDDVDAKGIDVAAERYIDQAELYQTAVRTLGRQLPKVFFLFVRSGLATSIPVLMA